MSSLRDDVKCPIHGMCDGFHNGNTFHDPTKCYGEHSDWDWNEDGDEPKIEYVHEVGNKLEIFGEFMRQALAKKLPDFDSDYVIEHEPTCAGCGNDLEDGEQYNFNLPIDPSIVMDHRYDGSLRLFKVDFGQGWKFDIFMKAD